MTLDDLLKSPALRRVLSAGEERMGRVMGRVLASESVTSGLRTLFTSALGARETFERAMQEALHAANLPSRGDVAALKKKLEELESLIDGLAARVGEKGPAREEGQGGAEEGEPRGRPRGFREEKGS
ncbi:MAG TPA: hypothetical protein VFG53_12880 [Anaeromyxobacter sp.]|nr:hypothetical protein [Anaeromyxobacter sp.]